MLELLQARERIGVPELARRLEVGERTVRRYAAMLREMGIPVEAELGRYGAYSLRCPSGTPRLHPTPGSSLGHRVRAKRSCRSSRSAFGILTWKGCTLISD